MSLSSWQIQPPIISVIGGASRNRSRLRINSNCYIQITADSPDYRIYFTTDNSEPDPFQKSSHLATKTYRYRGPFTLNPGPCRTVHAVTVSRSGEVSCTSSKDFEVKDINEQDEGSTGISCVSDDASMFDSNTYTLESECCSPGTAATLSDVYFSPRGRVYLRGKKKHELDEYFDDGYSRSLVHPQSKELWQSSDESDAETEVNNYFRNSRSHRRTPRNGHKTIPSYAVNKSEYYHGDQYASAYESPKRSLGRVRFPADPVMERTVSAYTRTPPERFGLTSASQRPLPPPVCTRSLSPSRVPQVVDEGGRRTPLTDVGYEMGQRFAAQAGYVHTQPPLDTRNSFRPISHRESTSLAPTSDFTSVYNATGSNVLDMNGRDTGENSYVGSIGQKYPPQNNTNQVESSQNVRSDVTKDNKVDDHCDKTVKQKEKEKKKDEKSTKKSDKKSSSSSSSSSSSTSESEADKKKKKKKMKWQKDADNSNKNIVLAVEKRSLENSTNSQSAKAASKSEGGLNFINDSGTQINFWGAKPEEIMRQMESHGIKSQWPLDKTEQARHTTDDNVRQVKRQIKSIDDNDTPAGEPLRVATTDNEQKSFSSAFRDFFGFGKSKSKKKKKNRDVDESDYIAEGYEQIQAQCLQDGCLWEDPEFPAIDAALFYENRPDVWPVEWKRPHEICSDPEMFVSGASRFDVKQGVLGNCWLLAAVASLSSNEQLIEQVVPPGQSFKRNYAGIFRFRFWQYGEWKEVCVDDRLPTKNNRLIYMHSAQRNEFWTPLLEKAYAKLNLCYESLSGGQTNDAMTDFTGGCVEKFNFREELPSNMFNILLKAQQRQSLMGCSIDSSGTTLEEELPNGLIMGHAYTITDVKLVVTSRGTEELVRVRNPWGNECEWKGAWHDGSKEWNILSSDMKKKIGLTFEHDGEFWMSFRDFSTHFQRVEICNLQPDCLADASRGESLKAWNTSINHGQWKQRVSAGGCRNYPKTFWTNPQFNVHIMDIDDDDEEDVGTIIVGVMQSGRRKLRKIGQDNLTIGYEIYARGERHRSGRLSEDFLRRARTAASSTCYINSREVCGRHRLPPGHYTIIPTTFEPNEEAEFVVRIFSEKENGVAELDEKTSLIQVQQMAPVNAAAGNRLRQEADAQFQKHGEDNEIDAYELKEILNSVFVKDFQFGSFDLHLCRSIIAMTDSDMTGKLEFEEFQELWQFLQDLKVTYKQFDKDQSGSFNSYELREALKSVGYNLSNSAFNAAVMRFSDRDGCVKFDDFVACAVKLKPTFDAFREKGEGAVTFTLDDLVQISLHA